MNLNDLTIWSYLLETEEEQMKLVLLERTSIPPEPEQWAIRTNGEWCLSKYKKKFCYEPLPSTRDKKYYKEFRFDSAQEALAFWIDNRGEIVS